MNLPLNYTHLILLIFLIFTASRFYAQLMEPIQQTFRYDVFISFRGEDTRNNFTSHLYATLKRHKFDVFHDTSLPRGLGIALQLSEAIDESKIFLVVFSANYADSKWCLDELSQMMQCVHLNSHHIVLPVFLDVSQSDVGTQQGTYKVPFTKHHIEFEQDRVQKWRDSLQEAGQLPGLHLQDDANGDEEELLGQIVEKIRKLLHGQDVNVADDMHPVVGIQSRMQEMISLLNQSCEDDVCVLAISGPAEIGKTEIAKATYNHLAIQFRAQYCCFIPGVNALFGRPNGKVDLLKMIISNLVQDDESHIRIDSYHQGIRIIERMIKHQKVLLVLDDVDNDEQLKIFRHLDRANFGRGSRIIVTTRYDSVVGRLKPDATYKPRLLDESESVEVFCLDAFGQKHPKGGYEEVSREAMRWGAGRPGVLKDTAARLRCFQSVQQWVWALTDLMHNSSW